MNKKQFKEFFEAHHFKVVEQGSVAFAYGVLENFPITVVYSGTKKMSVNLSVETGEIKQQIKALNRINKKFRFMRGKDGVIAYIVIDKKQAEEDWRLATGELLRVLRQAGIRPASACALCGQGGCDALIAQGGFYMPVHKRCVDEKANQTLASVDKNENEGNYITGVIGAILGTFVGVLPSVLTSLFMDTIHSLLFALIPLCIYGGYKLFKGKMNRFVIVLTIILSVLSVYLLQFEVCVFWWMKEYGLVFSEAFALLGDALTDSSFLADLTVNSLMEFFFVALGILIAWGQIRKTNVDTLQETNALKDTMMPYGDPYFDGAVQTNSENENLYQ